MAIPTRARRRKRRTQTRDRIPQELERVRQVAKRQKGLQLTALLHHIYSVDRLREAYLRLRRTAAAGVDGQPWQQYGEELEVNLQALSDRLNPRADRARAV